MIIYRMTTERIEVNKMFKYASVSYHKPIDDEFTFEPETEILKGDAISFSFLTPTSNSDIQTSEGLSIDYSIEGCSQSNCGDISVTFEIYEEGTNIA